VTGMRRDANRALPGAVPASLSRRQDAATKSRQRAVQEQAARAQEEADARHRARVCEVPRQRLAIAAERWGAEGLKPDAAAILETADRLGVQVLYHVTGAGNLPTILQHGILSVAAFDALGIIQKDLHGYGRLEKAGSLSGHVALSIVPHRGMIARIVDPVILACDTVHLARRGTFYADRNTARGDVVLDEVMRRESVSDLEALFDGERRPGHLRDWQSEVWVPEGIDRDRILAIIYRSNADAEAGRAALEVARETMDIAPCMLVSPWLFAAFLWSPPVLPIVLPSAREECPF
jgi:ssDNA thymidine ADP-ribosyltransferase, DarT